MKKDILKIFIALGFFAFAGGTFYSFQQLWLQDNNLSLKTISIVYSLCAFISVSVIFLSSNLVHQKRIKSFVISLFIIKFFILLTLFFLNNTGLNILIKFLIMLDYAADVLIGVSIYPMIAIINKSDKLYAKKDITYSLFYYIGAIIVSLILGKIFLNITINYNFYNLLGAIAILGGIITLLVLDLNKYLDIKEDKNNNAMFDLLKIIKKDKISQEYLLFKLTSNISYDVMSALLLTILVSSYNINPSKASLLILIVGIISSFLGMLTISFFTFKNDYINMSIKFLTRTILYFISFLSGLKIMYLLSIIITRLGCDSYGHISDAPYVNRIDNKYQFAFCNFKEMIGYLGVAIGSFFAGIAIEKDIKYVILITGIFSLISLLPAYRAIYLRKKENAK